MMMPRTATEPTPTSLFFVIVQPSMRTAGASSVPATFWAHTPRSPFSLTVALRIEAFVSAPSIRMPAP